MLELFVFQWHFSCCPTKNLLKLTSTIYLPHCLILAQFGAVSILENIVNICYFKLTFYISTRAPGEQGCWSGMKKRRYWSPEEIERYSSTSGRRAGRNTRVRAESSEQLAACRPWVTAKTDEEMRRIRNGCRRQPDGVIYTCTAKIKAFFHFSDMFSHL